MMAMRFAKPSAVREVLSQPEPEKPKPVAVVPRPVAVEPKVTVNEKVGTLTGSTSKGDAAYVCASLQVEHRDVWLVDSGATCHIVSADHLSGFRVCKYHDRTVTLYSASGDIINVSNVVDLEVRFGDVSLTLEDVLVAEVPFNVVSPWSASERGWKTHLARTGSRIYKGGKKNVRLVGAKRAWWAISGKKQKAPKRPSKGSDMEIDSLPVDKEPRKDITAGPSILKKTSKEAKSDEKPGKDEKSIRHVLTGTPFEFMLRGLRAEVRSRSLEIPEEHVVRKPHDMICTRKTHVLSGDRSLCSESLVRKLHDSVRKCHVFVRQQHDFWQRHVCAVWNVMFLLTCLVKGLCV